MNPEEEIRQENASAEESKGENRRVFGEDDVPVRKKKSPAKKVDGAIGRADPLQDDGSDPVKPKKKKSKKKKKKRAAGKSAGETFMRLGRGLKTGSVAVTEYSRKAMRFFDSFTSGDDEARDNAFTRLLERFGLANRFRFSTFILATAVVLVLILIFFNNTSIAVENVTVSVAGLHEDLEGYTICLISDLHGREFGSSQTTLLRAINGADYDVMVMTGDMVGKEGDPQPLYDLLDGISGSKPVYFIAGDSDPGPEREYPNVVEGMLEEFVLEDWVLGAIERGAVYVDSPERLAVDDAAIWFTPGSMLNVESSSTVSALNKQVQLETNEVIENKQAAYNALPFSSYRQQNMLALQTSLPEMATEDLHVSLCHIPPVNAPRTSDGSDGYLPTVDLILAGHNCGGVWRLPIVGALYIPSVESSRHGWFPAQSEVQGLSMLGSANMYISGGLGVTDKVYLPDFRFNNQPKVTLLRLTAALTDDLLGIKD